jgi:hypothetical protein
MVTPSTELQHGLYVLGPSQYMSNGMGSIRVQVGQDSKNRFAMLILGKAEPITSWSGDN